LYQCIAKRLKFGVQGQRVSEGLLEFSKERFPILERRKIQLSLMISMMYHQGRDSGPILSNYEIFT
jgi:hypothetical protein